MNHQKSIYVIFLLAIIINYQAAQAMENNNKEIKLSPYEVEDVSSVKSIKLIETGEGVKLLASTTSAGGEGLPGYSTTISIFSLEKDKKSKTILFTIPQLLPPHPKWDVAFNSDGSHSAVYESAGGALNSIQLISTKKTKTSVTKKYPFQSFSKPHFIKHSPSIQNPPVTVISEKKHLVIFEGKQASSYGEYKKICDCYDAVIIKNREHIELFYKVVVSGLSLGNVMPGILYHMRLNEDFSITETVTKPLGNNAIFEFDVDIVKEKLAIIATSEEGITLSLGLPSTDSFKAIPLSNGYDKTMISQPSILTTKTEIFIAVIESVQPDKARILLGNTTLDSIY